MFPTLLKIGPFTVHAYGLMIAIGFLIAVVMVQRDGKKVGIDPRAVSDMAFWLLVLGVGGSRLLHILMYPSQYSWRDPIGWIAVWQGGLVYQGAPIPVAIYGWFATRRRKINFWQMMDCTTPYVAVAHAVGRIGCFLNGCCYGKPTSLPWGVCFRRDPWDLAQPPTGSPAFLDHCQRFADVSVNHSHWSHPVHPTQLYSVVMLITLCLVLLYLRKKWHPFPGFTLPLYFFLYSIGRFVIEFFRGDHNPTVFGLISYQQMFSILAAVGCTLFFLVLRQWARQKDVPATPK